MLSLICIVDNLKLIWKLNSANNWKTTGEFKFSNSTIYVFDKRYKNMTKTKKKNVKNVAYEKQLTQSSKGIRRNAEETWRTEKKKQTREAVRPAHYFWRASPRPPTDSHAPLFLFFHEIISDGRGFRHRAVAGKKRCKEDRWNGEDVCHRLF